MHTHAHSPRTTAVVILKWKFQLIRRLGEYVSRKPFAIRSKVQRGCIFEKFLSSFAARSSPDSTFSIAIRAPAAIGVNKGDAWKLIFFRHHILSIVLSSSFLCPSPLQPFFACGQAEGGGRGWRCTKVVLEEWIVEVPANYRLLKESGRKRKDDLRWGKVRGGTRLNSTESRGLGRLEKERKKEQGLIIVPISYRWWMYQHVRSFSL